MRCQYEVGASDYSISGGCTDYPFDSVFSKEYVDINIPDVTPSATVSTQEGGIFGPLSGLTSLDDFGNRKL